MAQRRRERGVKLNHPEAIALISDAVIEAARDGKSVAEAMQYRDDGPHCRRGTDDVPDMVSLVQVEATFLTERNWSPSTIPSDYQTRREVSMIILFVAPKPIMTNSFVKQLPVSVDSV